MKFSMKTSMKALKSITALSLALSCAPAMAAEEIPAPITCKAVGAAIAFKIVFTGPWEGKAPYVGNQSAPAVTTLIMNGQKKQYSSVYVHSSMSTRVGWVEDTSSQLGDGISIYFSTDDRNFDQINVQHYKKIIFDYGKPEQKYFDLVCQGI